MLISTTNPKVEINAVRNISPVIFPNKDKLPLEKYKIVEGGLAECPNCNRTFFPDRLAVHLNS